MSDDDDGTSLLIGRLPTEHAHACLAAIDSLGSDPRFVTPFADTQSSGTQSSDTHSSDTIGERRSQALVAMLLGGGNSSGAAARLRAHIDITISLDALLGGTDNPAELAAAGGRATSVSALTVRELLCDPAVDVTLRRQVTDPLTGHLLDAGRRTYSPSERLRSFVSLRDRVCRFPGCRRRAARCQTDHADAWDDGGETSRANLGALCVRHPQLKTHGGWQISGSQEDGSCTWMSPQGRPYEHDPPPF